MLLCNYYSLFILHMVLLKKTKTNYQIIFEEKSVIDLSLVYNSAFFSIFPLQGVRVYKNNNTEEKIEISPDDSNDESDIEETPQDKVINIFGKERTPNSYSELPLENNSKSSNDEEDNDDNEEENLYDTLSGYLTKYLSNNYSKENINDGTMKVTFPFQNEETIFLLKDTLQNDQNEPLFLIHSNSNVTYSELEKIIKYLYLQIKYLYNLGYFYKDILLENVFVVQDKIVIFDDKNIDIIEKNDNYLKIMNTAFLKLVANILDIPFAENEDFISKIKTIENTQLYYFLKRIDREGVMEWI